MSSLGTICLTTGFVALSTFVVPNVVLGDATLRLVVFPNASEPTPVSSTKPCSLNCSALIISFLTSIAASFKPKGINFC